MVDQNTHALRCIAMATEAVDAVYVINYESVYTVHMYMHAVL